MSRVRYAIYLISTTRSLSAFGMTVTFESSDYNIQHPLDLCRRFPIIQRSSHANLPKNVRGQSVILPQNGLFVVVERPASPQPPDLPLTIAMIQLSLLHLTSLCSHLQSDLRPRLQVAFFHTNKRNLIA